MLSLLLSPHVSAPFIHVRTDCQPKDIQLPHVPLVRDVGFLISNVGRRATSHCLDDSQTMCLSNRPGWLLCGALDKPLSALAPEEAEPLCDRAGGMENWILDAAARRHCSPE